MMWMRPVRPAAEAVALATIVEPLSETPPACGSTERGLLGRWMELSELERRAFLAIVRELTVTSTDIESCTIDLSNRFQALAECARSQVGRVEATTATARCINVDGEQVAMSEATAFIEAVLVKVIDTVLSVSKNAMRMVYSLDDVARDVEATNKCVAQLQAINRQTRFLALNAAIEAVRAGAHGATFQVIAHEVQELSKQTDNTVGNVSARIASISGSVPRSHEVLQEIATVDMSEHITAKERLDAPADGDHGAERRLQRHPGGNRRCLEGAFRYHRAAGDGSAVSGPNVAAPRPCHRGAADAGRGGGCLAAARPTRRCREALQPGEIDQTLLERMVDKTDPRRGSGALSGAA